jgi:hypothetical protein
VTNGAVGRTGRDRRTRREQTTQKRSFRHPAILEQNRNAQNQKALWLAEEVEQSFAGLPGFFASRPSSCRISLSFFGEKHCSPRKHCMAQSTKDPMEAGDFSQVPHEVS